MHEIHINKAIYANFVTSIANHADIFKFNAHHSSILFDDSRQKSMAYVSVLPSTSRGDVGVQKHVNVLHCDMILQEFLFWHMRNLYCAVMASMSTNVGRWWPISTYGWYHGGAPGDNASFIRRLFIRYVGGRLHRHLHSISAIMYPLAICGGA